MFVFEKCQRIFFFTYKIYMVLKYETKEAGVISVPWPASDIWLTKETPYFTEHNTFRP